MPCTLGLNDLTTEYERLTMNSHRTPCSVSSYISLFGSFGLTLILAQIDVLSSSRLRGS